jgi:S-adenosylmethionine decarboxylase proenzyme
MGVGVHLILDCYGCNPRLINDEGYVKAVMLEAASTSGCTIIGTIFHSFPVQGVSGVVVIEESHLSIHSWPELEFAAIDAFTCGNRVDMDKIKEVVLEKFEVESFDLHEEKRGTRLENVDT